MEESLWSGRASRDIDIYRQNFLDPPEGGIILAENAAADAASSNCDDDLGFGRGAERLEQSQFHVPGHRSGNQKHVCMTRRRHEVNAETLDVIDRIVQSDDLELASVAGPGIDLANSQRLPQQLLNCSVYGPPRSLNVVFARRETKQLTVRAIRIQSIIRGHNEVAAIARRELKFPRDTHRLFGSSFSAQATEDAA